MFNFAYSVSRTSRASSRARSSIFTEDGDIEMDFFTRQVKKIEASMKTAEEKKSQIIKEMDAGKQVYKALKASVAKQREIVGQRQKDDLAKMAVIKAFDCTEEQASDEHARALEELHRVEREVENSNRKLQLRYEEINEVVASTKSIQPPNPEYPALYAKTEALKLGTDNRRSVIRENEIQNNQMNRYFHELEIQEMSLNGQILNLSNKTEVIDDRKEKSLAILAEPIDQSLDILEKLVLHLEQNADQVALRYSSLKDDNVDKADYRSQIMELDRVDAVNSKRRYNLTNKYDAIKREKKSFKRAIRARQGLSRENSGIVRSKRTPEEVEEIINERADALIEKYHQVAAEVKKTDDLELKVLNHKEDVENQWREKMRKVESIQAQNISDDQAQIKINQLENDIENEKQLIVANSSKIEMLQRRAKAASDEFNKNMEINPELVHSRIRVEEKQQRVDNKQADLENRKALYHKGVEDADNASIDLADLLKRTLELENRVKEMGVEIEQAKIKMQNEQTLLDQALSKVPLDKKIQILENL